MAYSVSDAIGGFDNNGDFHRVCNWTADKNAGIKILAEKMDAECDNFAYGFDNCLTRDGRGKPLTDFDFNNNEGINLDVDLDNATGAVNVETLIKDPTRLYYDESTSTVQITLANAYMNSVAGACIAEGYHFLFVAKNTMSVSDFHINYRGTVWMAAWPVVGPDGAPIPENTIKSRGIYSAVIFVDRTGSAPQYKICILNAYSGGGGGGGGRVDTVQSDDNFLDVVCPNPAEVHLSLDADFLIEEKELVLKVNGTGPDDAGNVVLGGLVKKIDGRNPDINGNIPLKDFYIKQQDPLYDFQTVGASPASVMGAFTNLGKALYRDIDLLNRRSIEVSGTPSWGENLSIPYLSLGEQPDITFGNHSTGAPAYGEVHVANFGGGRAQISDINLFGLIIEDTSISRPSGVFTFKNTTFIIDPNVDSTLNSYPFKRAITISAPCTVIFDSSCDLHLLGEACLAAPSGAPPMIDVSNGATLILNTPVHPYPSQAGNPTWIKVSNGGRVITQDTTEPSTHLHVANDGSGYMQLNGKIFTAVQS